MVSVGESLVAGSNAQLRRSARARCEELKRREKPTGKRVPVGLMSSEHCLGSADAGTISVNCGQNRLTANRDSILSIWVEPGERLWGPRARTQSA